MQHERYAIFGRLASVIFWTIFGFLFLGSMIALPLFMGSLFGVTQGGGL